MSESDTTVGIVGAGPAGLVVAHILRRFGIPFVLLERHPQTDLLAVPKAGLIEYRTVKLLETEEIAPAILEFSNENGRCEFRSPEASVVLDYAELTGGRPHYIYPQHELVARLAEALVAGGADVRFGAEVTAVRQTGEGAVLAVARDGAVSDLVCNVVIGCDGPRGPVADALDDTRVVGETLPVRWLAMIGQAPPLEPHTIYAAHPRGFAGQMRRGPTLTRYFLQVDSADTLDAWPERRMQDELSERLGVGERIYDVPLGEATLLDLRVKLREPMQQGRIFLAGDAAHLFTPAGGKGMNLAIQDAVELAHGLAQRFGPAADGDRLERYSETRLRAVWRTQAFSNWMLRLILAGFHGLSGSSDDGAFSGRVRDGWITSLQQDPAFARWFAFAYAGVDPD